MLDDADDLGDHSVVSPLLDGQQLSDRILTWPGQTGQLLIHHADVGTIETLRLGELAALVHARRIEQPAGPAGPNDSRRNH